MIILLFKKCVLKQTLKHYKCLASKHANVIEITQDKWINLEFFKQFKLHHLVTNVDGFRSDPKTSWEPNFSPKYFLCPINTFLFLGRN